MKRKFIKQLVGWQEAGANKPLVVYGARQVGKSYGIIDFAKQYYGEDNYLEVDFERNKTVAQIFKRTLDPKEIVRHLEGYFDVKITPGKTLIFFDEIQRCPEALNSLKFFAQDAERESEHYHVICAGSLLGVSYRLDLDDGSNDVIDKDLEIATYPVGKDQQLFVYPMDFEEFLWANNKALLVDTIRDCFRANQPLTEVLHLEALHYYLRYLIVGGMPEAVRTDVAGEDYKQIQRTILNGYKLDIVKYIRGKVDKEKTRITYEAIPRQLGQENKRFFYAAIRPEARGKNYRGSVQWLSDARLVIACLRSKAGNEPPSATEEPNFFKLYLNDVGLLSYSLGITEANYEIFEHKYHGALTENYVAQTLYARSQDFSDRLHYWVASEDSKSAEIDFLISTDLGSVPIEVKSALNTTSKSLNSYLNAYQPRLAYRLSQKNLGYNPEKKIKSVPLYAVFCLD